MNKYIKESDLKKYLDKQYKDAVRYRDENRKPEHSDAHDYYEAQIEQLETICDDFELGMLGL